MLPSRYIKRRAREGFREAQGLTDAGELQRLWETGRQQLAVVKRQSLVYSLYSRRHKHAMVGGDVDGSCGGWKVTTLVSSSHACMWRCPPPRAHRQTPPTTFDDAPDGCRICCRTSSNSDAAVAASLHSLCIFISLQC